MKLIALGAAGEMGQYAARMLAQDKKFKEIIIGDLNLAAAQKLANKLGSHVNAVQVDVTDKAQLLQLFTKADLVLTTVGPYFKFGVPVLQAAIEARCNYVDINDDWEPTLEMLALHERAEKAGVCAVIGAGASPGVTNLLAAKALAGLDVPESIYTGWLLDSAQPEARGEQVSAAMVHGMHQLTGKVKAFQDGDYVDIPPRQRFKINYPGVGEKTVFSMGHPESVTLPRYYPTLKNSNNVMVTSELNMVAINVITQLVDWNLLSLENAARVAEMGTIGEKEDNDKIAEYIMSGDVLPPMFALAEGKKENRPLSVGYALTSAPFGGMAAITSAPLAVVAQLMARGKIKKPGVYAPEAIVPLDDFFELFRMVSLPRRESAADMVVTTTSDTSETLAQLFARL